MPTGEILEHVGPDDPEGGRCAQTTFRAANRQRSTDLLPRRERRPSTANAASSSLISCTVVTGQILVRRVHVGGNAIGQLRVATIGHIVETPSVLRRAEAPSAVRLSFNTCARTIFTNSGDVAVGVTTRQSSFARKRSASIHGLAEAGQSLRAASASRCVTASVSRPESARSAAPAIQPAHVSWSVPRNACASSQVRCRPAEHGTIIRVNTSPIAQRQRHEQQRGFLMRRRPNASAAARRSRHLPWPDSLA